MRSRLMGLAAAALLAGLMPGAARAASPTSDTVLVAEGERLWAFDVDGGVVGNQREFLPASEWVNGPPCFIPGDRAHRFYEADDNPDALFSDHSFVDGDQNPFFGLFSRTGTKSFGTPGSGDLAGKTLVSDSDNGALWIHGTDHDRTLLDPAGCVFDAAGNFVGVDVGSSHLPMDLDRETPGFVTIFFKAHNNTGTDFVTSCIIDAALSQPGFPAFDAHGDLLVPETGNAVIWKYSNMPASASECDGAHAVKSRWSGVERTGVATPSALARDPSGGWALSSVLAPPEVVHLSDDGTLNGMVALPGPATGTPFGLGYDRAGNLFYADLGLQPFPSGPENPGEPIGPGQDAGSLKMVKAGGPPIPTTIASSWNFPDGLTVVPTEWLEK